MADHRSGYKSYLNKKSDYITSFEILQYDDAYIELVYENEFESKNDLARKEGEYIREMNCVNRRIEGRTQKEYQEEHKEQIIEKQKEYYEKHKKQIAEKSKIYYEENKDHILERVKNYSEKNKNKIAEAGKIWREKNKDLKSKRDRKYRVEHKEHILEKEKKYRDEHKTQITERRKVKITCVCGLTICKGNKATHERSQKHQSFMNTPLEHP
jgi:hypothetical protein